ncbi:hypothetical protein GCM10009091_33850 [Pseudomonas brenneri]|nr:hypothetical protein GCM10009091_33850 [Pseudomonas brenneri]
MTSLFTHYALKDVTLGNRILASPLCHYHVHDGLLSEWHKTHYETFTKKGRPVR